MDLANLGSEWETCVGSRVRLVGAFISFKKNFYRLPFTPPSLVRRIDPSDMSKEFEMSMMGKLHFFSWASDQAGEGGNLCTSSEVHEGHPQEVQNGLLEAPVNTVEYDYRAQCGRGRRARGLEGVPGHDRLPLVLDS
jgi:hypothetical protein